MLRFHTAYSSSRVKDYFATADYYADGPETVGFWHGGLCRELGLEPGSPVSRDDFGKLCDNINPATAKRLTLRTNEHRRVGDDMIFSLSKDVSAFILLAPPALREELLAMVQERVLQVCDAIEADVETRVRRDGAFENRPGDGMAVAGHRHTTARPVAGQVADPHVHCHMFGFNATRDGVEGGRIKAADFANIYRDSAYYESLFLSLVSHDFARLGLPVVRRENGKWGLAGLESLIGKFSKRTDVIEAEARRLNITDREIKDGLGAKTRRKKEKELGEDQLRAEWDAQLTDEEREALQRLYRGDAGAGGTGVTAGQAVE